MIKMKPLLKESTWTNRKFGESLPTLEDYMGESYDDENCGDGHAVVSEADDDDKYVSIGWGKYKEKGKEDDENAPSFTKTDSGKYVKAGGDEKGGDAPEKEPAGKLGGGDFERDFDDDEDDYDMGVVPGSRELDDTPEDDSEKGSSLTSAPGRVPDEDKESNVRDYLQGLSDEDLQQIAAHHLGYEPEDMNSDTAQQWVDGLSQDEIDDIHADMQGASGSEDEYPDQDPINTKKGEMEDEMEDIASELDNVTDPDERKELEDRYDKIDQELSDINKKQYGDDSGYETFTDDPDDIDNLDTALDDDPTRGDPDDSWDDEEGRAKPSGGDFTKSADYDMWSDDDELAISGTDSDDPAGGKGDAWMTGDDEKQKGMYKAKDLAKKGMKKRPGGEQAEIDYQKADQMMAKYAGVDIEKAEFWAKKKKQAADAMMGEITINGKKYKPITESINPTIFDPHNEIKRMLDKISTRQFDRKYKKEII